MKQERSPGQYKLESVSLYSSIRDDYLEIVDIVGELNIYEDMFKNAISANMIIEDEWSIMSKFPLVGHEDVIILPEIVLLNISSYIFNSPTKSEISIKSSLIEEYIFTDSNLF